MELRTQLLWDVPWLVLRGGLDWSSAHGLPENLRRLQEYFDSQPTWVRAFRIWRLVHQVQGFFPNPALEKEERRWRGLMNGLDRGGRSVMEGLQDTTHSIPAGLTLRELRCVHKALSQKWGWRKNPYIARLKRQLSEYGIGRSQAYQ